MATVGEDDRPVGHGLSVLSALPDCVSHSNAKSANARTAHWHALLSFVAPLLQNSSAPPACRSILIAVDGMQMRIVLVAVRIDPLQSTGNAPVSTRGPVGLDNVVV